MAKKLNRAKLQKELEKRKQQKHQKEYKGYMIALAIMVALIHLLDEYASSVSGAIQTSIVDDLFVKGMGISFAQGLSMLSIVQLIALVASIFAGFFKSLSDRFGRKPFLFISTLGMALGMLLCAVSKDAIVYFVGRTIMGFFVATDFQVLYITEVAPDEKRSTFYSVTKAIGTLGIVLIAVARGIYTTGDSVQWRLVYMVPSILGLILSAFILFGSRETNVFLEHRIEKLENQLDLAEEGQDRPVKEKGNMIEATKLIFRDKQLRMQALSMILFMASMMAFTGYYESVMSLGGMNTEQVTKALAVYPVSWALLLFVSGFISDRFGRKKSIIIFGIIAVLSQIGFVLGANKGMNDLLVGIFLGGAIGGYWTSNNNIMMMTSETAPTELRASVSSVLGMLVLVATLASTMVYAIVVAKVPLDALCIWGAAITMGAAIIFTVLSTEETAGSKLK